MRPKLKELGYSDEQIDDMTLAELFELIDNIIEELCED
jgi:hypothetical protein